MGNRIANYKPQKIEKLLDQEDEPEPELQPQPELQPEPVQNIYKYRLPDLSNYHRPSGLIELDENCGYVSGTIRISEKLKDTEIEINIIYYMKCRIMGERRSDLVVKFIDFNTLLIIASRDRRSDSKDKHNNWYKVPLDYYWKFSSYQLKYMDIYQPPPCFHIEDILICCTRQNLVVLPEEMWKHIKLFV